jgi:hypothetical protein
MQKNRKYLVIFGITVNLISACLFGFFPIRYYTGWDTLKKIYPDKWLATDEELLHILNYGFFPMAALVMIISAILLWKLRK